MSHTVWVLIMQKSNKGRFLWLLDLVLYHSTTLNNGPYGAILYKWYQYFCVHVLSIIKKKCLGSIHKLVH